jgi:hypothetical protein
MGGVRVAHKPLAHELMTKSAALALCVKLRNIKYLKMLELCIINANERVRKNRDSQGIERREE